MAKHAPPGLLGIHVNYPGTLPTDIGKAIKAGGPAPSGLSADELRAYEQVNDLRTKHYGYAMEMENRPQALTGLAHTAVGLAALMIDHFRRSCGQLSGLINDGQPIGDITRNDILGNITLYWFDEHGNFFGPYLLGKSRAVVHWRRQPIDSGSRERFSGRDLSNSTELHRKGSSQLDLFPRGGKGRPFCSLGTAKTFLRRGSRELQIASRQQVDGAPSVISKIDASNKWNYVYENAKSN
jgi:hypothetical protein